MKAHFKKVPALYKCIAILELLAESKDPMGVSDISRALNLNKSTVFNTVHTLADLEILAPDTENKFVFGTKLYVLGKAAGTGSEIIRTVHPYLALVNQKTRLSAFLGTRSGLRAVIVDKIDSDFDIKISSEIGMRLPLLAGAGGKVLLSQLPDEEVDRILSQNTLKKFTRFSCVDKEKYKQMVKAARADGIAVDKEEYIEGVRALAVALNINRGHAQFAIWAVGLKRQMTDKVIGKYSDLLRNVAKEIELRLSSG